MYAESVTIIIMLVSLLIIMFSKQLYFSFDAIWHFELETMSEWIFIGLVQQNLTVRPIGPIRESESVLAKSVVIEDNV